MAAPPIKMIPLPTQEMFETLYNTNSTLKESVLIYFTAQWCGACKRIDWGFLNREFPNLKVYKCDVDENNYTPGFCGVRSIPNFSIVHPGKRITGPMQSSDTAKVASWIQTSLVESRK
jgi:thioredoxin-like negative regulator of GroEL